MRHDGRTPMQLGDSTQIDGERELDLLPLPQPEIRGLDENARGAEIHGATQLAFAAGNVDVDGGAGPMAGMETAFHGRGLDYISVVGLGTIVIMPSSLLR